MDISPKSHEEAKKNPNRSIRGTSLKNYVAYMHQIERGSISEKNLIDKKILLPGKGIALNRDDKIFHSRSHIRGKNKKGYCSVPYCHNLASRRGLCNTHRVYAKRMIRLKKATEANLIRRGLLLPRNSIPIKNPVRSSLKRHPLTRKFNIKHCLFPECKQKCKARGLCKKHHCLYLRKASQLDLQKRQLLEKDLIKRKLLLPRMEVSQKSDSSAFELGSKIRGKIA